MAEGVLHRLRHVVAGEVGDGDLRATLRAEPLGEELDRGLRVAVDGGVGDEDALRLRLVLAPGVVEPEVVPEVLGEDGAVERADRPDLEPRGLLEHRLHLRAVLADDAEVVAAGLARPALGVLDVVGAELAEAVGGEEDLVRIVVGHEHLGPVDHRRRDEVQRVAAEGERGAVAHDGVAAVPVRAVEVLHHRERLGGGDDLRVGERLHERGDVGGVVGLHVLDDQVVRLARAEGLLDVVEPLVAEARVDGVHHGDAFVDDGVGVVGHAARNAVLALEEVDVVVVDADVADVVGNGHGKGVVGWNGGDSSTARDAAASGGGRRQSAAGPTRRMDIHRPRFQRT